MSGHRAFNSVGSTCGCFTCVTWHCADSNRQTYCVVMMCAELSVDGTDDVWFINFYSPRCSHCHELAPAVSVSPTQLGVVLTTN